MKPRVKLFTVLVAVAFVGTCLYKVFHKSSEDIILNGNVEIQDVKVSFRGAGRVAAIHVEEGRAVKSGDVLSSIDTDILESQLRLAKAKMDESEANFNTSKKDFERNKILYKNNSVSEKVFDDISAKYKTSMALKDAATANYELAKINLNDAVIKSPVDGVILTKNIEIGEMISAGIAAFSIMPDKKTRVKTFVNEATLSKIKYNDTVYVNIETMPERKFKGHIGFIASEAEFTPRNIETKELRTSLVYRVRVIIDENAPELKQGMPVTISYNK